MPEKVIFSGDNPGITLMKPGTDQRVAVVAYWRCAFSAYGEGNALLIWVDSDFSGLGARAPQAIYTDNPGMAKEVTDRFSVHFPRLQDLGFETMEPQHARFDRDSDSRWYYRAVCNTNASIIELAWWDILDQQMLKQEALTHGGELWDLYAVMCPCASASIRINDQLIPGEVRSDNAGEKPSSSTFVALSETWVHHGE
jgi:hypothetical protein